MIGVFIGKTFYHFARRIDQASLLDREARKTARKAHTLLSGLLAGLGILGGVLFLFLVERAWELGEPSFGTLLVALGLGALLDTLYFLRETGGKKRIPIGEVDELAVIPSLDVIDRAEDASLYFTQDALLALERAYRFAVTSGHAEVSPLHIFVATFEDRGVRVAFMRLGIHVEDLEAAIKRQMGIKERGMTLFHEEAEEIAMMAFRASAVEGRKTVSPVELFSACFEKDAFIKELVYSLGIEEEEFFHVIAWARINEELRERYKTFRRSATFKPTGAMNRAYTSVATPFLDRVGEDLTTAGVRGGLSLLVGRKDEMSSLLRAIEGGRQSVVLVGPQGSGKEAMIEGLAERMINEDVPKSLRDKRLVRLSLPHILQSGLATERLLAVFGECARSRNIILVIENVHELASSGVAGVDLATLVATELEKGYTFIISTTTPQSYTQFIETSSLAGKLQRIPIEEPDLSLAIRILESKVGGIENEHKVVFTFEAIKSVVEFSSRYLHEVALPESAIVLAREVGLFVAQKRVEWQRVTKEDVATVVSQKVRVPVTQVSREEKEALLNLEERMHARMVGQDEAVRAVASSLRRARAELRSGKRPIANFLFLGPTGVGKTELAKTTAEVYFGNENAMLRFDMSEYQDSLSSAKLIGVSGAPGLLTEAVRRNPFALVLLDELEKAHPDILNLFLQVMDDGRLTDGLGRTIDFTNVILIATSNAGTQFIQDETAKGAPLTEIKTALLEEELKTVYRPEFLNRFDGIIVFTPLTIEDVTAIAYLLMKGVEARLEEKGIYFMATDKAVHDLAKMGYDPKFGARPLRRVVQEQVDDAIAELLLKDGAGRRDTIVLEAPGMVRVEKARDL